MKQKVSVSIVTYNNEDNIEQTVESLLSNSKGVELELFVVDNASTDNTVKNLKEKFPQVNIITTEKNIGFGAGHNLVIPKLSSKYHAIVNPDIIIREDVLAELAYYLDENEDIGMLSPKILNGDGQMQVLGKRNPSIKYLFANRLGLDRHKHIVEDYAMLNEDLTKPTDIENATGCFMFLRTCLFMQNKGFDERFFLYFEDADLTRRINKKARTQYYPYAKVYHEWARGGAKNAKLFFIQLGSMFKYFLKWGF